MGENVGTVHRTMGAKLFGGALRTEDCANKARKCAYIEVPVESNEGHVDKKKARKIKRAAVRAEIQITPIGFLTIKVANVR